MKADRISPVMRFFMSLVSSLFLHSSRPETAAVFGWEGQEVDSGLKAEGGTGRRKHRSNDVSGRKPRRQTGRYSLQSQMNLQLLCPSYAQ